MVDVTFVSSNAGKAREVRAVLAPYGVRVRWRRAVLPELQVDDLAEVARAKALAVRGVRGLVLVEDSGLFVRSLNGFPGVYSAHFLELWGFGPMLELLRRRPREAAFRCEAVLRDGDELRSFRGEVPGTIARRPAGTNGFGYDPIFVPRGYRTTFGVLSPEVKNLLSHRARAMRRVGAYLRAREQGEARRPASRRRGRVDPVI